MTLQLHRNHQTIVANPKWRGPLTRFVVRGVGKTAMVCLSLGLFSGPILGQSNSLRETRPPAVQRPVQHTLQENSRPISNSNSQQVMPPVHAQPIRAIAGGRKSIKSRLFKRNQETDPSQQPKPAGGIEGAAQMPTRQMPNGQQAQQRMAESNRQQLDEFGNPLRRDNQQQEIQQVAYLQDGLNWRQRGSYYPASQQQPIESTRLQGPMQDDWSPARQNQAPINDPFDDGAVTDQAQMMSDPSAHQFQNQQFGNSNQISPPRMRNSGQSPTPADPRTNPNQDSIQEINSNAYETLPAPNQSRQFAPQQIQSQLIDPSEQRSQTIQQQTIQYEQPRRVEPRRMHSQDARQNRVIPSTYRRNQDGQDNEQEDEFGPDEDDLKAGQGIKSCDEYRSSLLNRPITEIVVDISGRKPVEGYDDVAAELGRQWRDRCGQHLATGTFLRLERSYAIISNENGQEQQLYLASLGDADLAEISGIWGLPVECTLGCFQYYGRCWTPQTVSWYASNLCHKPLYFEDIQLERYGHSAGPFHQPVRSTAHFFYSVAMLPYHKRINPPNECMYALGYYRPGNCAPWLVDPFPISLEGASNMAIDYTVGGFIFP